MVMKSTRKGPNSEVIKTMGVLEGEEGLGPMDGIEAWDGKAIRVDEIGMGIRTTHMRVEEIGMGIGMTHTGVEVIGITRIGA